ncbi:glycosyltransferase [Methyloprofundus sp.]|uniref:glycosyltransferase n=1 Tax=Methyloprofundus sp. TaxID=2020875 RepID=UPI003D0FC75F
MQNWVDSIEQPVVSICCTTYNHEPYIAEAIDGFLIQETDFPFEILIRDDCSTDKTAEIVKQYADQYPQLIKPVYEKENTFSKGVKPMPTLITKAIGKYIALCEGDDYWTDPEKLQIQIDLMQENSECYLSFHPVDEVLVNEPSGVIIGNHVEKNKIFTDMEMFERIRGGFCPTASIVIRRKVMDPPP